MCEFVNNIIIVTDTYDIPPLPSKEIMKYFEEVRRRRNGSRGNVLPQQL